jgi:hypothetical protein
MIETTTETARQFDTTNHHNRRIRGGVDGPFFSGEGDETIAILFVGLKRKF